LIILHLGPETGRRDSLDKSVTSITIRYEVSPAAGAVFAAPA